MSEYESAAAARARRNGQDLEMERLLQAARSAQETHRDAQDLLAELERLRGVEDSYVDLLEEAAQAERERWNPELRRPLAKLGDDAYVSWVGSADAPASYVMTEAQVRAEGWSQQRIDRAMTPDEDGYLFNFAGPGGKPLTVAAMIEAYASRESQSAFVLTPEKVLCGRTSGREDPVTGQWDDKTVFWDPWAPDEVPDQLPEGWPERF